MKVLVTGVKGQLGSDCLKELNRRSHIAVGTDIEEMDITDLRSVTRVLGAVKPDAVIHCAAWTAVDAAENNVAQARLVNAVGTENIAAICKKLGCKMLYTSTDYVFDGQGTEPWHPDCQEFRPLNVYGQTKLEGELAVKRLLDTFFIVRIAWVFGKNGNNFVRTMLRLSETRDAITVVDDQIGTPTYTADLARLLVDMIETNKYGCYHATNEGGYISWCDFAKEIFRQAGLDTEAIPVTTEQYGKTVAKRPLNSRLDKSKLSENGFTPLPDWKSALRRYITELNNGTN